MLILCEKPSVAKDFAGALGCEGRKGYYQNVNTIITYCVGHLFELASPELYNAAYKTWDANHLPIIPQSFRYIKIPKLVPQTDLVLSLLKKHAQDSIVIATDAGREGELIARIVLAESGITDISHIKRFWVSEALTKEIILDGLQKAKPLSLFDKISQEGFVRQRADWLVGINLTRYMTIGNSSVFSVGRVQTAVLNAIATRNKEVAHFISVPFMELEATVQSANGTSIKAWLVNPKTKKTTFFDSKDYVIGAQEYCQKNPISKFESQVVQETRRPEKLLNITGLQKAAYKLHGYSPEKTLELAQSLYEKYKCLSYPRTPSRVMGDHNVSLFRGKYQLLSRKYSQFSRFCDETLITQDNKNIFNSAALEDHHALIPLTILPEEAPLQERTIYEIVLTSFFTVCMKDYIFNNKQLLFYSGDYIFRAKINEIIQAGFKAAVQESENNERDQEVSLFDEKTAKITHLAVLQKKTNPKKEFSIDTLLGFMENPHNDEDSKLAGLGTPATRAAIIKVLFTRSYIREENRKLLADSKGLFLLEQLQKDEDLQKISDVAQTTEWENQLQKEPENFERSIISYIKSCIKQREKDLYKPEPVGICPLCGKPLAEGIKNYYCTGYKDTAPCHFSIWKNISGAKITAQDVKLLISHNTTKTKKCFSKEGKPFSASFVMEKDGKIAIKYAKPKKV